MAPVTLVDIGMLLRRLDRVAAGEAKPDEVQSVAREARLVIETLERTTR